MERRGIVIDLIHVGERNREPNLAKVAEIAKSIKESGLFHPPAVRIVERMVIDGEEEGGVPVLIYGRHRLLALKSLGINEVECDVYQVDDLRAELMEIDENLARSELTAAEESACIIRRKELWNTMNGGGKKLPTSSTGQKIGFAAEVAAVTGSTKRDINQKIARARDLGNDLKRVTGTSLDSGVELDALRRLPTEEREALIARAAAGEKVSARPAPPQKPMAADKALDVIANGLIESATIGSPLIDTIRAAEVADTKAAQRAKFWKMWGELDDDVREGIIEWLIAKSKAAS